MSGQRCRSLTGLIERSDVVVCTGAGGVGKTTTAAALALEGALRGRKACVVTIDPARRLAHAMGLEQLSNQPTQVDLGDLGEREGSRGELWALMLDTEATFDDLVRRHAESPEQAETILGNTFYRNIAGSLSGTQEYMAMEKLYELHTEGGFDLVVVDTPPTHSALDFLDAPTRLTNFLDHRLYRVLVSPGKGLARAVNVAAQTFLRSVSRVAGSEVVGDAITFFRAFDGMEQGFRERATRVDELLSRPGTSFVLVAAPRRDVVEEASYFLERLAESSIEVRALVVNRVHPQLTTSPPHELRRRAEEHGDSDLGRLYANLADFAALREREDAHVATLSSRAPGAHLVLVPYLSSDVHDLRSLREVGGLMASEGGRAV